MAEHSGGTHLYTVMLCVIQIPRLLCVGRSSLHVACIAYISGIKVFNQLPQYIKALTSDHKYFKSTLKRFLHHHSFYSMNEYIEYKEYRRI